ncbi:hypothetical protein [Planomonospora sp. ID82291]|uniref:hypothetical protein n=1 Tax=Planomonospora sp. ID82291 TaxID=2738136 RepID=UPI0018C405F4|nr:hypothetical protein [Planomonospora sp. ID82291]MBG0814314.1 hypothetical protein [Planomonospora sp. ID82291]
MAKEVSAAALRAALRKAQQEHNRQVKRAQTKMKREVDQYNRKVEQNNRRVIAAHNRQVDEVNRKNQQTFNQLTARLRLFEVKRG